LLVDFAYRWNEDWLSDERDWKKAVVAVSGLLYIADVIILVFLWKWFGGSGCERNQFFIAFTIVFTLIFTIISITEWCEHGALLPSAVVTSYCYGLLFSALNSDPSSCNTLNTGGDVQMVLGIIVTGISVGRAAWNLATSDNIFGQTGGGAEATSPLADEEKGTTKPTTTTTTTTTPTTATTINNPTTDTTPNTQPTTDTAAKSEPAAKDDEELEQPMTKEQAAIKAKPLATFFIVLSAASMYMAMLLTNWGSREEAESGTGGSDTAYNLSVEAMWVKIVTEWVTGILYIWSLVAPYVLKDRDFS